MGIPSAGTMEQEKWIAAIARGARSFLRTVICARAVGIFFIQCLDTCLRKLQ